MNFTANLLVQLSHNANKKTLDLPGNPEMLADIDLELLPFCQNMLIYQYNVIAGYYSLSHVREQKKEYNFNSCYTASQK